MSDQFGNDDQIIDEIRRCQLATPSAHLRKRALNAAIDAWATTDTTPTVVPWALPTLRLATCFAVTVLIVCFANIASEHSVARWQSSGQVLGRTLSTASLDLVSQVSPGRPRLVAVVPVTISSQKILNHMRRLSELLNIPETSPADISPQAPTPKPGSTRSRKSSRYFIC